MWAKTRWLRIAIVLCSCSCLLCGCTQEMLEALSKEISTTESPKTAHPAYQEVLTKLENLRPGKTITFEMGIKKDRYAVGEPFEIKFQVSQPCYLVLMELAADNSIRFLAPSRQVPNNRIEGSKVYSTGAIPRPTSPKDATYDLGLNLTGLQNGEEAINFFCSTQPINLFDPDFAKEPFYTVKPDDANRLKALSTRLDQQFKDIPWAGGSITLTIGVEPAQFPLEELTESSKSALKQKPGSTALTGEKKKAMIPRKLGTLPPIGSIETTGKWFPPIDSTGTTGKTEGTKVP